MANGYLCRSKGLGCYSDLLGGDQDLVKSQHGCIDLLPKLVLKCFSFFPLDSASPSLQLWLIVLDHPHVRLFLHSISKCTNLRLSIHLWLVLTLLFASRDRERNCQNEPGSARGEKGSLLLCCHQELCNHVDSPETRTKYNETLQGEFLLIIITVSPCGLNPPRASN